MNHAYQDNLLTLFVLLFPIRWKKIALLTKSQKLVLCIQSSFYVVTLTKLTIIVFMYSNKTILVHQKQKEPLQLLMPFVEKITNPKNASISKLALCSIKTHAFCILSCKFMKKSQDMCDAMSYYFTQYNTMLFSDVMWWTRYSTFTVGGPSPSPKACKRVFGNFSGAVCIKCKLCCDICARHLVHVISLCTVIRYQLILYSLQCSIRMEKGKFWMDTLFKG